MQDKYEESGKLIRLSNAHESSDKKETKKQHHGGEKEIVTLRKDYPL